MCIIQRRMTTKLQIFIFAMILLYAVVWSASVVEPRDGVEVYRCKGECGRALHRRQSGDQTQPPPKRKSHQRICNKAEERQAACLHGKCYVLLLGDMPSAHCKCPEMYEGKRCELLSMDFFLMYGAEMKRAAIIGGVVFAIILIIIAISVYFTIRKRRMQRVQREQREQETSAKKPMLENNAPNSV